MPHVKPVLAYSCSMHALLPTYLPRDPCCGQPDELMLTVISEILSVCAAADGGPRVSECTANAERRCNADAVILGLVSKLCHQHQHSDTHGPLQVSLIIHDHIAQPTGRLPS